VKVKDVMQNDVATLRDTETLEAAEALMAVGWIRHLPVTDSDNRLVGIVTHRDLLRASLSSLARVSAKEKQKWLAEIKVCDVMTKGVKTATPEMALSEAVDLFLTNKFGGLPVVVESKLVGMLTETDLLEYLKKLLTKKRGRRNE
jgi:CBS domain-containing membrane protein